MNALTDSLHRCRSRVAPAILLLAVLVPAAAAAQAAVLPDPLPVQVLPEGRVLRVELACGDVLWARMVHRAGPDGELRLALVEGGVRSVPAGTVVRSSELPGTVREARFWAGDPTPPALLTATRAGHLAGRAPEGPGLAPGFSRPFPGTIPDAAVLATVAVSERLSLSAGGVAHRGGTERAGIATGRYDLGRFGPVDLATEVLVALVPEGGRGGATGGVEAAWSRGPRTVHLGVGTGGWVRGGASWRPVRRWSLGADAFRAPGGETSGSLGARYLGGTLRVEGGLVAHATRGETRNPRILVRPAVHFRHLR